MNEQCPADYDFVLVRESVVFQMSGNSAIGRLLYDRPVYQKYNSISLMSG
jgi:hypothetical protein